MTHKSDLERTFPETKQIDGEHYLNKKIQPFTFCRANNFNITQANIIKYASRLYDHVDGPMLQLEKIIHYCELEIRFLKDNKDEPSN
jgi:hypothetical protein